MNRCCKCAKWRRVRFLESTGICERLASKNYMLKMANRTLKTDEVVDVVREMLSSSNGSCMYWKGLE